jgi:hypothetical protein
LPNRQRFSIRDEGKETSQCGQAAVPGSDAGVAVMFEMVQKGEDFRL